MADNFDFTDLMDWAFGIRKAAAQTPPSKKEEEKPKPPESEDLTVQEVPGQIGQGYREPANKKYPESIREKVEEQKKEKRLQEAETERSQYMKLLQLEGLPRPEEAKRIPEKRTYFRTDSVGAFLENFLRPGRFIGGSIAGNIHTAKELWKNKPESFQELINRGANLQKEAQERSLKGLALEGEAGDPKDIYRELFGDEQIKKWDETVQKGKQFYHGLADKIEEAGGVNLKKEKDFDTELVSRSGQRYREELDKLNPFRKKVQQVGGFLGLQDSLKSIIEREESAKLRKEMGLPDFSDEVFKNFKQLPYRVAAQIIRTRGDDIERADMAKDFVVASLYDPLNYIPFGKAPEFVGSVSKGALKASLAGIEKVSPRLATAVENSISKASKAIGEIGAKISPKYGAEQKITEVLGKEGAIDTIESLKEAVGYPAYQGELLKRELLDTGLSTERLGFVRKKLNDLANSKEWSFKNHGMRWLFGQTPGVEAQQTLVKALRQAEDASIGIIPDKFKQTVKNMFKGLTQEKVSPEELERLIKSTETLIPKKATGGEIIVKAGQEIEDAINYKYADDLRDLLKDMRQGFSREGIQIAKDRKALALETLKMNHSTMRSALQEADNEITRLNAIREKGIRSITREEYKRYQQAMGKHQKVLQREAQADLKSFGEDIQSLSKELLKKNSILRKKDLSVVDLEGELSRVKGILKESGLPEKEIAAHPRVNFLERVRGRLEQGQNPIQQIRGLTKQVGTASEEIPTYMKGVKNVLDADMERSIVERVGRVEKEFMERTGQVKFGLPTVQEVDDLYKEAIRNIEKQFNSDKSFFSQQATRVKFLDTYNKMLSENQTVFDDIFERSIQDLPQEAKNFARVFNQTMDAVGAEEVARGRLNLTLPNYFPRFSRFEGGGPLVFDPEAFATSQFSKMGGTGISRFTQQRAMANFDSFKKWVEEHGGKTVDDPWDLIYQRFLRSKMDQAHYNIKMALPNELKVGEQGKAVTKYLDYLFNAGKPTDDAVSKFSGRLWNGYKYYNQALLTVFSPTYHIRDSMGYPFLVAQGVGLKGLNPANFADAAAMKVGVKDKIFRSLEGKAEALPAKDLMEAAESQGLLRSSFTRGIIPETLRDELNRYSKADPRFWIGKGLHLTQSREDVARLAAAVAHWKEGEPLWQAVRSAKKTMYDFSDFNYIDRALSGLFAFYSFSRKNVPGVLKNMLRDPKQYALLSRTVDTLSSGRQPTEEETRWLNQSDRNVLMILRDLAVGKQMAYRLGFLPAEAFWQDFGKAVQGKPYEWFGDTVGKFAPQVKILLREMARNTDSPTFRVSSNFAFLPSEYSAMPDSAVKMLSDLSQTLGWGPVKKEQRLVYKNGEAFQEMGVKVPPRLYDVVTMGPFSRLSREWAGLYKNFSEKKGIPVDEATVGRLLDAGAFQSSDELIRYVTGLRRDVIDWNQLRDRKVFQDVKKLKEVARSAGLIRAIEYMPKDVQERIFNGIKYKDILKEVKRLKYMEHMEKRRAKMRPEENASESSLQELAQ